MSAILAPFQSFAPARPALVDGGSVNRIVGDHARKIGCDTSNVRAAIAWAFEHGTHTIDACNKGKARAEQLRARQPATGDAA